LASAIAVLAVACLAAACQGGNPGGRLTLDAGGDERTRLMQAINQQAQQCWRKERAFSTYRIIPELDTRVGNPRILILRAGAAQGLPRLVIQAEGSPVRITTFGPLAAEDLSSRINADLARWSRGEAGCDA
jgi:hypothetical protein